MSVMCERPLHCVAIHQINIEISEIHSTLRKLCFNIDYMMQFSLTGNPRPTFSEETHSADNNDQSLLSSQSSIAIKEEPCAEEQLSSAIFVVHEPELDEKLTNFNVISDQDASLNHNNTMITSVESDNSIFPFADQTLNTESPIDTGDISLSMACPKSDKIPSNSADSQHLLYSDFMDQSTSADLDHQVIASTSTRTSPERESLFVKKKTKPRIRNRRYCKACNIVISDDWIGHVAHQHFKEKSLICDICGFRVAWNINHMKQHFRHKHFGQELSRTRGNWSRNKYTILDEILSK